MAARAALLARRAEQAPRLEALGFLVDMPGESHVGALAPFSSEERALAKRLKADVEKLSLGIGERNLEQPREMAAAAGWIAERIRDASLVPTYQRFDVEGRACRDIVAQVAGGARAEEIVVIGAHYDTVAGTPGANDNGTGVAACLALARSFAKAKPERTLRFVFFANEEPPRFREESMGSLVYARACREKQEKIVAMLSLETMGYYSDEPETQRYPAALAPFFPSTGDFIAFASDEASVGLLRDVVGSFRRAAAFPSEGLAGPSHAPGIGWSDHWSFWQAGYPGAMVTDTAPFRYPWYHAPGDTPEKLDFDRLARVVEGLRAVVRDLASPAPTTEQASEPATPE